MSPPVQDTALTNEENVKNSAACRGASQSNAAHLEAEALGEFVTAERIQIRPSSVKDCRNGVGKEDLKRPGQLCIIK